MSGGGGNGRSRSRSRGRGAGVVIFGVINDFLPMILATVAEAEEAGNCVDALHGGLVHDTELLHVVEGSHPADFKL
jgi:hypothetical protein